MKTNSISPSFQGVIYVGSASPNDKDFYPIMHKNAEIAEKLAKKLELEKGQDTFVLRNSYKDAQGRPQDEVKTFVLTDEDAAAVNEYGNVINYLESDDEFLVGRMMSDRFDTQVHQQTQSIKRQQQEVAMLIAENKKQTNLDEIV